MELDPNIRPGTRFCEYLVVGPLKKRRFFAASLILALFYRFYEEGDAASIVIPNNSQFRNEKFIDEICSSDIHILSILNVIY